MNQLCILCACSIFLFSCGNSNSSFTDTRDGEIYKTVQIGNQIWMAENLRFDSPNSMEGDKASPQNGRFYTWEEAQKIVPDGWHLPSGEEWDVLGKQLGMSECDLNPNCTRKGQDGHVGEKLKSTSGWGDGNGIDKYEFNALPVGFYHFEKNQVKFNGEMAPFWSTSESSYTSQENGEQVRIVKGRGVALHGYGPMITIRKTFDKMDKLPIRCIKD
ncbi:MAG: hypothetical protein GY810_05965 [Aureispira sp.]|nr:hypothetical protein [Aureispira sp.]